MGEKDQSADQGRTSVAFPQQSAKEEVNHQGVKEVKDDITQVIGKGFEGGKMEVCRQTQVGKKRVGQ